MCGKDKKGRDFRNTEDDYVSFKFVKIVVKREARNRKGVPHERSARK